MYILLGFCITGSVFAVDVDPVGSNIKSGVKKYRAGDFSGSLESFHTVEKDLKNDQRLDFNKGNSYYKLNDFQTAARHFEKSANTEDPVLKLKSLYNLGNANAKLGDKKAAIKNYLDALKLDPNFTPARQNLELLRRKEDKNPNQNQEGSSDSESNEEKEENQNSSDSNKSKQQNPKSSSKPSPSPEDSSGNKKMTKSEAERILESSRQDNVKRRKLKERKPDYDDMFW